MENEIKRRLEIIEEAINDWRSNKLSDLSALIAIGLTIDNKPPSDECIKWAIDCAIKHMKGEYK